MDLAAGALFVCRDREEGRWRKRERVKTGKTEREEGVGVEGEKGEREEIEGERLGGGGEIGRRDRQTDRQDTLSCKFCKSSETVKQMQTIIDRKSEIKTEQSIWERDKSGTWNACRQADRQTSRQRYLSFAPRLLAEW